MRRTRNLEDGSPGEILQENTATRCFRNLLYSDFGLLNLFVDTPSVQCRQPGGMYVWMASNSNLMSHFSKKVLGSCLDSAGHMKYDFSNEVQDFILKNLAQTLDL